ncbi:MAG TPA: response regulator transcription factor [Myxococcales bacterium]|nr:response regulator transcription factor [Myxococcales bacterium]
MTAGEGRTRLYVVEDQPALLRQLLKALSVYPELEVVGSAMAGAAALEEIPALSPDLALLDLELPDLSGLELTRRLKRARPEVEVLILTAFDDEQKVYEAMLAGASGYLVKRVGPEKIRGAIHEVMAGGTVLEPIIARRFWNYFQSVQATPEKPENPWGLTGVELEVLGYVAKGLSNAEVGQVMSLEHRSVRTALKHIYRKMGVSERVDAVVLALRAGCVRL